MWNNLHCSGASQEAHPIAQAAVKMMTHYCIKFYEKTKDLKNLLGESNRQVHMVVNVSIEILEVIY